MKITLQDFRGSIIKLLLCVIIWYSGAIQYKFFIINNFLMILGVFLFALTIIDALSNASMRSRHYYPAATWMIVAYILLTLMLGILVSPDLNEHFSTGITSIEYMLVMIVIIYVSVTRGNLDFLIWNYIFLALFLCVVFFVDPETAVEGVEIRYSFSSTMNPNSFAMSLTMGTWSTLYMVSRKKIKAVIGVPICFAMLYAIFNTGSKTGLFGLIVCFALWIIMCYIPVGNDRQTKKYWKILFIAIFLSIGAAILLPYYQNSVMASRITNMSKDASTLIRFDMYLKGIEYLKESPILGYGYSGYAHFYGHYSHSTIVEVFVSSGIPLGLLYFFSYLSIWRGIVKCKKIARLNNEVLRERETLDMHQGMILFFILLFYTICVIHIYEIHSFYCFGVLISMYAIRNNRKVKVNENYS